MIVLPALAAAIALVCAAFVGFDAVRRPRPERAIWTLAFLVFAIAAGAEVLGQSLGWSVTLARVYYLTGAVLVVGILALGEVYLLLPSRLPAVTPGFALLIVAVAVTAVWSAPVDAARLPVDGWRAIERGPFLVALAAAINAGGTIVLAGGALVSAWRARTGGGSARRAAGCVLIATGTLAVAAGGTLTRFGRPEYLYLAMAAGIAVIFAGIVLTRSAAGRRAMVSGTPAVQEITGRFPQPTHRVSLETREGALASMTEGARFVARALLEGDQDAIAALSRQWGATPVEGERLSRAEAQRVWALRLALPDVARDRLDALSIGLQAQLAELYAEVWSAGPIESSGQPAAGPAALAILPMRGGAETRGHEHV